MSVPSAAQAVVPRPSSSSEEVVGGAATSPSGLVATGTRPLSNESVFRIEVSLSSRKSSAIVMRTTARLYSLEGSATAAGNTGDAEWRSVAYGAPCLQLMRLTTEHNSPFKMKIVMAEVESGIALWENEVDKESNYHPMQSNFHTFSTVGKTFAIQFANDVEASRMLESVQDLLLQKEKAETVAFDKKGDEAIFKKPKPLRRLSKKDISTPCNFKHVSGITLQRTSTCEEELRGTIQRKMRSMSLSALNQRRGAKNRPRLPDNMVDGSVYAADRSPDLGGRKGEGPMDVEGQRSIEEPAGKSGSLRHKFNSLRLTKKKGKTLAGGMDSPRPPHPSSSSSFTRDEKRMSLPSNYRRQVQQQQQQQLVANGGPGDRRHDQWQPSRALSLSSGNLVDLPSPSHPHHPPHPHHSQSQERLVGQLDRRHTVVWDPRLQSPTRKSSSGSAPAGGGGTGHYNYTPYSKVNPQSKSSSLGGYYSQQQQQQFEQFQQQKYQQQQLLQHQRVMQHQQQQHGPHGNQPANGRLSQFRSYQSDMSLNRPPSHSPGNFPGTAAAPDGGGRGQAEWRPTLQHSQSSHGGVASYGAPPTRGVVTAEGGVLVSPRRRQSLNEMQLVQMDGSVGGGGGGGGGAKGNNLQQTTIMEEQRVTSPSAMPGSVLGSGDGPQLNGGAPSGLPDHMSVSPSHVTVPASYPSHVTIPSTRANVPTSHVTSSPQTDDVNPYASISVSSSSNPSNTTGQTSSTIIITGQTGSQSDSEHYDILTPKSDTPIVRTPQAPAITSQPPPLPLSSMSSIQQQQQQQQAYHVQPKLTSSSLEGVLSSSRQQQHYTPVPVQPPTVGTRPIQPQPPNTLVEVQPPQAPKVYTQVATGSAYPSPSHQQQQQQQQYSGRPSGYQQHSILQSSPPQARRQTGGYGNQVASYVQPVHTRSHSQPHRHSTHQGYGNNPSMQQGVNPQYHSNSRGPPPHVVNYPQGQVYYVPSSANGYRGAADTQVSPSHTGMQVAPVAMQQPMKMQHQAFESGPIPAQIPRPYQKQQAENGITGMRPSQGNPQTQQQRHLQYVQGSSNRTINDRSPQRSVFQPNSTAPYDTLPVANVGNSNISSDSRPQTVVSRDTSLSPASTDVSEELAQYTEQMSKALEQFDCLLQQPQSAPRQIMQTSL